MSQEQIGSILKIQSGRIEVRVTARDMRISCDGDVYHIGQIGSYVTIPSEGRRLVGFVISAGYAERGVSGRDDDLRIEVQLLGEIAEGQFNRGINDYPVVGDPVCVAVRADFETIFGSFDDRAKGATHAKTFNLGKFALNTAFDVNVLGTEFLAKHVAILGNSGAGKSCTTARILQQLVGLNRAQIVLFDLHGEYRAAFCDETGRLDPRVTYVGADDLVLPYWLLKYEEFEAMFVDRSNPLNTSTQISFLRTALLEFKQDAAAELGLAKTLTLDTPIYFSLDQLKTYAENLNDARYVLNDDRLAFTQLALRSLTPVEQDRLMRTRRCSFKRGNPEGETPHPLYFGKLLGFIDQLDTKFSDRRYEFLLRPLEHARKSSYFKDKVSADDTAGKASGLLNDLIRLLTGRREPRSKLTIVDLSGIPFEIVDVTVAVLTRLLFELNFWTPPKQRHPTLLVFEEAHNYIPRTDTGRHFARAAVERIAKEGRKYGVSAMVVSQRPSELSETVLAQCNNLIVMRLNNPEDQRYVTKVISDNFASLVEMLPVLRPGEAFVIGDCVVMPMRTLVQIPEPRPQSDNMDFFKIWSADSAETDVDTVIDHWRRQNRQILEANAVASSPPPIPAKPPEPPPAAFAPAGAVGASEPSSGAREWIVRRPPDR